MPVIPYDEQNFAHLHGPDTAACRRIARKLIRDAVVLLYRANETNSHSLALAWTDEAADYLHAAGKLLANEPKFDLLRLSARLHNAILATFGHPNEGTLDAVADEAEKIADTLAASEGKAQQVARAVLAEAERHVLEVDK